MSGTNNFKSRRSVLPVDDVYPMQSASVLDVFRGQNRGVDQNRYSTNLLLGAMVVDDDR